MLMLAMLVMPMIMVSEKSMVRAEEDELEEEDEGTVEEEEGAEAGDEAGVEEDESKKLTSPDADTVILFTKPPGTSNLGQS